jgi:DNA-binding response OmpR family regulator
MAIAAGVSEYMVKPFSVGALESKIRRIIEYPHPHLPSSPVNQHALPLEHQAPGRPVLLVVDDVAESCHELVGA